MNAGDTVNVTPEASDVGPGGAVRDDDPRWLVVQSRTIYDSQTGGYVEKATIMRRVIPHGVDIPDPPF